MNDKSVRVLEFNKIKEQIKTFSASGAGKELIDNMMPYDTRYEAERALKETDEAMQLISMKGNPPFEGLYDVRGAVTMVGKGGTLMASNILKIGNMLKCARRFKEYVVDEENPKAALLEITDGIVPLKGLENNIFNIIISEDEISDRASSTLFNIRKSLKEKNASIKDKVNEFMRNNSKYLQESLYTIRGDRYVVPVKAEFKGAVNGLVHDQSSSGATLFMEPMSLVKLNNDIKELMLKEKAEIERLLAYLSSEIYKSIDEVSNNSKIIWEMDFIFAKAKYAMSIDGICPSVSEDGSFDIVEGCHPLIDRNVVVPSTIKLGKDFSSIVITGPNTGGKTVTLKTVGLLHVMALSGVPIPARENTTVAFYKEIFADIGDEQSIEQSLSTFSSHMTNIVNIINKADEESLVLFDELGAGTDPTEGAALAISILEYLRKRKVKIIATTHYSELKVYGLKTDGVENASVEFNVETLKPTYRLLLGIPGKSNAFEISKRLGLNDDVIGNAKNLVATDSLKFEDVIENLQNKRMTAERDARIAESLKEESKLLKEQYEKKIESLEKSKEREIQAAKREARNLLREAKDEADKIIKDMREMEKLGYTSATRSEMERHRKNLKDKIDKNEEKIDLSGSKGGEMIQNVTLGMDAMLTSLNQKVSIISMPDSRGEVQVQAGIMKINVKLSDLRKIEGGEETKSSRLKAKRELKLNMRSVASSVDLRGMDSQEAEYTVDKYLDEAYMAGLGEVSIIHGKGTGVLRKAIGDMLKRHPHVKNYRLGEYGEGGHGVTIVQIK